MVKFWNSKMEEIDRERAAVEGTYFGLESTTVGYRTSIAYAGELVYVDQVEDYGTAVDRIMTYFNFLLDDD
ncbi:MAG: hypothetical protein ACYCX3_01900 [Thermoleophilia bacterium]